MLAAGICDVSEKSCKYLLTRAPGSSITIVVGGAQEALDTHPGTSDLTLNKRRGFVRVALQTGASLVPVFGFGENNTYYCAENPPGSWLRAIQERSLKALGFSLPLFHGRGIFNYDMGLLPFRTPLNIVVGKPIDLPKIESPSREDIDKYHALYVAGLTELYNQYKDLYDKDRKSDMKIVA
jgi:2-acylglycerol O-acyltransferase 2